MLELTAKERAIFNRISQIKSQSGTHSPGILTVLEKLNEVEIKVDACFLSNPYATDLFLKYLTREVIETGKIRSYLESYPPQNPVVAESLAHHLGISPKNIFIGNGAIEIIQAVIHNFARKKVIINIPTFSSYYEFARKPVRVVFHKLEKNREFDLDPEAFIRTVKREKPDTVVLINPNNPNGAFLPLQKLKHILSNIQEVETVIVDESFIHFVSGSDDVHRVSAIQLFHKYRNMVIIKSMSKDFGIAGLRAGYAVMDEGRVSALLKHGYLWNVSGLVDYFFKLYTRADFLGEYEKIRAQYITNSKLFYQHLSSVPHIRIYPTAANFALLELLDGTASDILTTKLLISYGIYVRDCADKIGLDGQFVRIASRRSNENNFILESLSHLFRGDTSHQNGSSAKHASHLSSRKLRDNFVSINRKLNPS